LRYSLPRVVSVINAIERVITFQRINFCYMKQGKEEDSVLLALGETCEQPRAWVIIYGLLPKSDSLSYNQYCGLSSVSCESILFGLCLDYGSGVKTLAGLMKKEQLPYQKTCRKLSFINTTKAVL